jgi:hypothetical protein
MKTMMREQIKLYSEFDAVDQFLLIAFSLCEFFRKI